VRIALDLGGGPVQPVLTGALEAARKGGHELRLFGPEEALRAELSALGLSENKDLAIHDAPGVASPEDDPQAACRDREDLSVLQAAACAASGEAGALVSVAPPRLGAAAAAWHLKRLDGVLKPAAAALIPTRTKPALLLDIGATAECKPWHLLQFALMGSLYARSILERREPLVGILASGTPGTGPSELVREALPLLKYSGVRFGGPIQADEVFSGETDVIVTDGDTGEIVLNSLKGFADLHSLMLESSVGNSRIRRLGARLAAGAFADSKALGLGVGGGGTALLGIGGTGVLCRGTSESAAEAVATAAKLAGSDFRERLQRRLEDVKSGMETERA
jgi:glycerol-3-phosphate acyltransferase PlsX